MARPKKKLLDTVKFDRDAQAIAETVVSSDWIKSGQPKEDSFGDTEHLDKKSSYHSVKNKHRLDPLTQMLGEVNYYEKMRFHFLVYDMGGVKYPLEVARYYQNKKVAFDFDLKDKDLEFVQLKKQILQENQIMYFHVKDSTELHEAIHNVLRVC